VHALKEDTVLVCSLPRAIFLYTCDVRRRFFVSVGGRVCSLRSRGHDLTQPEERHAGRPAGRQAVRFEL
jgi:hypothetical protein